MRTLLTASFFLLASGAALAQSTAPAPINPGAKAIIESYEKGCSQHPSGSAQHQKCRADAYKEISSNCQQLQDMAFNPEKAQTSGVDQKLEMWCGAKKSFSPKG